jgi:hypothetical protein
MTFTNGKAYGNDHQFVQDELAPLTPDNVRRWMCEQAYGTTEPAPDANPTNARSSSLMYWKKAISFFMPNRLMAWNAITGHGNLTRSIEVNELIKKVKKKEVRKQGADSQARRAITHAEFKRTQSILMAKPDIIRRYGIPSLFAFQYNLIARIDDSTQFKMENLTANPDFNFTLRSKLNWSKNVQEERTLRIRF